MKWKAPASGRFRWDNAPSDGERGDFAGKTRRDSRAVLEFGFEDEGSPAAARRGSRTGLRRGRSWVAGLAIFLSWAACVPALGSVTNTVVDVLLVVGAAGEKEYAHAFAEAVEDWKHAARMAKKTLRLIEPATTNQIAEIRSVLTHQPTSDQELWIVLIGHGTYDGKEAKLNLSGPDISSREMNALLGELRRPVILVNTASSSAPFINDLSATNRMIVCATRSGWEENYTRFGKFFAKAVTDLAADLDKDGQVSLLEAFLRASRQVEDFYAAEKRLATEHALLDDNGDGKGTPSSFFRGVRPAKKAEENAKIDGFRAHQIQLLPNEAEARLSPEARKRRNELELELERVRARKEQMDEAAYLKEIEGILVQLARLYHAADSGGKE